MSQSRIFLLIPHYRVRDNYPTDEIPFDTMALAGLQSLAPEIYSKITLVSTQDIHFTVLNKLQSKYPDLPLITIPVTRLPGTRGTDLNLVIGFVLKYCAERKINFYLSHMKHIFLCYKKGSRFFQCNPENSARYLNTALNSIDEGRTDAVFPARIHLEKMYPMSLHRQIPGLLDLSSFGMSWKMASKLRWCRMEFLNQIDISMQIFTLVYPKIGSSPQYRVRFLSKLAVNWLNPLKISRYNSSRDTKIKEEQKFLLSRFPDHLKLVPNAVTRTGFMLLPQEWMKDHQMKQLSKTPWIL